MNISNKIDLFKLLFLSTTLLNIKMLMAQTTYTVTSTSKDGPGSFIEAVELANNSPGEDIIEFTPDLQVDASFSLFVGTTSTFMVNITESVTIDGKGGALNGLQKWVSANGDINPLGACPGDVPSTTILRSMPNFMEVGIAGQDNSGIVVTVKNLSIKQFNSIAAVNDNAILNLDNFNADEIWSTLDCRAKGLIEVAKDASISLTSSRFTNSTNWTSENLGTAIVSENSGDLTIENCLFYNIIGGKQFLISWSGNSSAKVNIISSRMLLSGGIKTLGNTNETNIVNSIWVDNDFSTPKFGDRFINNVTGQMNIIASSLMWNSNACSAQCQFSGFNTLIESSNGPVNFIASAIGFNFESNGANLLTTLGGTGNGFTADVNTWIQPTTTQDETTLETITSQPALLTGPDAFMFDVVSSNALFDADFLTPTISGELIDVVNTTLLHPVSGIPITEDPLGNPREDANGFRDIGAIQLSLAPFLNVSAVGDTSIDINWNEPTHHNNTSIIRYEVSYAEAGSNATIETVSFPNTSTTINGLIEGTDYEVKIRAIYDDGGTEVNGPYGNVVTATPVGTFELANFNAVAGNESVALSWDQAILGGRKFQSYVLIWRVEGTMDWIDGNVFLDINDTSTTVNKLTNGTTYEFLIKIRASDEYSNSVFQTATPIDNPPTAICVDFTAQLDATGNVTITAADIDGGSTDVEGSFTLSIDQDTFTCDDIGANTVNLTITDSSGQSDTCAAEVTVVDNLGPEVSCMDITLQLDGNGEVSIDLEDIAIISDNCGILNEAVSIEMFNCEDIGAPVPVIVSAQDVNGNTSSCEVLVTVLDELPPVLTCPEDQTVAPGVGGLFEVPDYWAVGDATAFDNCTDPLTEFSQVPAPGTFLSDGTYPVTLTVGDEYGNLTECTFEVTVDSTLGVVDRSLDNTVKLYPNPASNLVNIVNDSGLELERVEIYDVNDRLVHSVKLGNAAAENTMNVSSLASGIYMVQIVGKDNALTIKRLLKQ